MKNIEIKEFDVGSFADSNLTKMQINFAGKMSLIQVDGAYITENQKIIELDEISFFIYNWSNIETYLYDEDQCLRYTEL